MGGLFFQCPSHVFLPRKWLWTWGSRWFSLPPSACLFIHGTRGHVPQDQTHHSSLGFFGGPCTSMHTPNTLWGGHTVLCAARVVGREWVAVTHISRGPFD